MKIESRRELVLRQRRHTLETDKTQTEIESPAAGKITMIGKSTPPTMSAP
jgi:hypothetical protein